MVIGSSPLARGLLYFEGCDAARPGIIPARAGFTRRPGQPLRCRPDHPRSRGVYETIEDNMTELEGSSPLARGLLIVDPEKEYVARIIPARAGFTHKGVFLP